MLDDNELFDDHNDDGNQDHEDRQAGNPMHFAEEVAVRCVGIFFSQKKILSNLSPDTHDGRFLKDEVKRKLNNSWA